MAIYTNPALSSKGHFNYLQSRGTEATQARISEHTRHRYMPWLKHDEMWENNCGSGVDGRFIWSVWSFLQAQVQLQYLLVL